MKRRTLTSFAVVALFACGKDTAIEDSIPIVPQVQDAGAPTLDTPGSGTITITPTTLDLGQADCGSDAKPHTITITNSGTQPAAYDVRLLDPDTFAFRDSTTGIAQGTIPAKDVVILYVNAKALAADDYSTDIIVKAGDAIQTIPAAVKVTGGTLAISPRSIDFGQVRQNTTSESVPVELANDGNEDVSITSFSSLGTDFLVTPAAVVVPAGQKTVVNVTMTANTQGSVVTSTPKPVTASPTCNVLSTLTLSGQRVSQDVLVGPLTADFGQVDCNTTPSTTKTVTVSNYNTTSTASFQVTLPANSRFGLSSPTTDTVPPAVNATTPSTKDIVLTAKQTALPLGQSTEDVQVQITSPAASIATSAVKAGYFETGALLTITPTTLAFAKNEAGTTKTFKIVNTGNAASNLVYTGSAAHGFMVEAGDNIPAGGNQSMSVKFNPSSDGNYSTQITVTSSGGAPLCAPPPLLTATGVR